MLRVLQLDRRNDGHESNVAELALVLGVCDVDAVEAVLADLVASGDVDGHEHTMTISDDDGHGSPETVDYTTYTIREEPLIETAKLAVAEARQR